MTETSPPEPAAPQPPQTQALLGLLDLTELGRGTGSLRSQDLGDDSLDLYTEDVTVFVGDSEEMPHRRVFGGQVLAQGVMGCGRTVIDVDGPARRLHSLHAYFLRPGDDTRPIHFLVERMRDGRSFSSRRLHAVQHGHTILSMTASFQTEVEDQEHQDEMPDVPGPEGLPSLVDLYGGLEGPHGDNVRSRPIEQRHVEPDIFARPATDRATAQHVWIRAVGPLPDDPLVHDATLAFASDYSLLQPVLRRHGLTFADPTLSIASLDHAMWFHRPFRADEWLLYAQQSPSAQGGRGLSIGRLFTRDGRLVATVAQEGMIRTRR